MKKKYRDIIVDGVHFGWAVNEIPYEEKWLKIWKDKKVVLDFHEIDYEVKSITPKYVEEVIKEKGL